MCVGGWVYHLKDDALHLIFEIIHCLSFQQVSAAPAQSLTRVWLCGPEHWSPPGSSVHGVFQVRILQWAAVSSSRGPSWPRNPGIQVTCISCVSCIGRQILYNYATWEARLATKRCKKTECIPMLKPSYPQGSIMGSGVACPCWRQNLLMDVLSEGSQKFPAAYTNCLVTKQSPTSPLEKILALTNEPNFLGWFLAAAKRLSPKGAQFSSSLNLEGYDRKYVSWTQYSRGTWLNYTLWVKDLIIHLDEIGQ